MRTRYAQLLTVHFPPCLLLQPAADAHFSRLVFDFAAHTALDPTATLNLPGVLTFWAANLSLDPLAIPSPPTKSSPLVAHAFPTTPVLLLTLPDPDVARLWEPARVPGAQERVKRFVEILHGRGAVAAAGRKRRAREQTPGSPSGPPARRPCSWPCEPNAASFFHPVLLLPADDGVTYLPSATGAEAGAGWWPAVMMTSRPTSPGSSSVTDEEYQFPAHLASFAEDVLSGESDDDEGSDVGDSLAAPADKHWPSLKQAAAFAKTAGTAAARRREALIRATACLVAPTTWAARVVVARG